MTKVTPQIILTITQNYLHAKTLDEIVGETGLSKGSVYKIVNDWNQLLGGTDIEEIRAFIATVRKSGMTIQECAMGFRIAQLLKRLGIRDDFDDKRIPHWIDKDNDDEDNDLNTNGLADYPGIKRDRKIKKAKSTGGNQIIYFIEKIYRNCKKFDVQPSIIINWIQDLFDCYSSLEDKYPDNDAKDNKYISKNKKSCTSLASPEEIINSDNYFDQQNTDPFHEKTYNISFEHSKITSNKESLNIENEENKSRKAITTFTTPTTPKDIPFVSKMSYYIDEKKQEIIHLKNSRNAIYLHIKEATTKKKALLYELENLTSQQSDMLTFFQWYSNLKQELQVQYNIIIEEVLEYFAKAINDFKYYNYDAYLILKDYKKIESIRQEIRSIQDFINIHLPLKESLIKEVSKLNDTISCSKQSINAYNELR